METIEKNRTPASEEKYAGWQALLTEMMSGWDAIAKLETHISEAVQLLITDPTATKEVWVGIAERIQWSGLKQETLLDVMIMVQGNPYGHIIIEKILSCDKVVKIEDFRMMLQQLNAVNLRTIAAITQKLYDNGNYHGDSNWEILALAFANKAAQILHENASSVTWEEMLTHDEWASLPSWLLRVVALHAFEYEHGHVALLKIVPLKALLWEDFVQHIEELAASPPELRWAMQDVILETERHRGFLTLWNQIFKKIFFYAAHDRVYNKYHGIKNIGFQNSGTKSSSKHHRFH